MGAGGWGLRHTGEVGARALPASRHGEAGTAACSAQRLRCWSHSFHRQCAALGFFVVVVVVRGSPAVATNPLRLSPPPHNTGTVCLPTLHVFMPRRPQADADAPKPTAVPPLLPAVEVAENLRPGVQDSPTATAGNGTDGAELPTNFAPTAPHNLDQPLLLLLDARQVLWEATAGAAAPPPYTGPADAGPSGAWLDTTTIEWATGAGVVVGSSSFRAGAASLTPPPPAHIEAAAQKARTEEQQEQDLGSHADGVGSGQAGQRRRQQQELATPSSATTSALRVVNVPLPGVLLVAVPPAALLGLGQQQGAGEPAAAPGVAVLTATLKTPTSAPAPAPRIGGMTFTAALAVTLNQPPQCALRLGPVGPGDNTSACFTVEFVATAVARTGLSAAANASGTPAAAAGSLAGVRQGALAAMVVVRAVGFVDPEGHLPLSYEFGVRHPSLPGVGTDAVVQLGDDSQAVLLLPPSRRVASNTTAAGVDAHGGANGGSVQVYVCVTDALGARTCVDRLVPLAPGESPGAGGPGATGGAVTIGTAAVEGAAGAAAALQRHLRVLQVGAASRVYVASASLCGACGHVVHGVRMHVRTRDRGGP